MVLWSERHRAIGRYAVRGESWPVIEHLGAPMDGPQRYEAAQPDEGRYRLLVDAITDYAIYMLDLDGRVTNWNSGAQRFKGYLPGEIIGQHFSRFYTEEDRAAGLPERALRTAETEGKFETYGWRVRKDGTRFWAHVIMDPVRDPTGELVGYAKITRDLTERAAAEETLRRSEEQFKLLVQSVTDYAIYMLDLRGHVSSWNLGAERIKGYSPGEIIGEHFSRFYTPEDKEAGEPQRALKTAETEGRFAKEGWRVRKDGSRFWASIVLDARGLCKDHPRSHRTRRSPARAGARPRGPVSIAEDGGDRTTHRRRRP
jgi:PAS domain S-box-containing protein